MIKIKDWIWGGHAGHFIMRSRCLYHLTTYIGDHMISTVGNLRPELNREYGKLGPIESLGGRAKETDPEMFYETMVWKIVRAQNRDCDCMQCAYEFAGGDDYIDGIRSATPGEARKTHMAMCHKYAKVAKALAEA